jgi:hypothetical protein
LSAEVALKVTDPVNPLTDVRVKSTPGAVVPDLVVVVGVQGVRAKSGLLDETTSVVTKPLELAKVPSPEYTAEMVCPPDEIPAVLKTIVAVPALKGTAVPLKTLSTSN